MLIKNGSYNIPKIAILKHFLLVLTQLALSPTIIKFVNLFQNLVFFMRKRIFPV